MHTPEQAKALWCPMARLDGINGSYNRETVASHEHPTCIADQCAMWRWEHTTSSVPAEIEGATGALVRVFELRIERTHGFCGIAVRPEVAP